MKGYTRAFPCPLCGGFDCRSLGDERCWGGVRKTGWIVCTRKSSRWPDASGQGWAHPPGPPAWRGGPDVRAPGEPDLAKRERKAAAIQRTWGESVPASDPAAAPMLHYLGERGLGGAPVPACLRCHPGLPYYMDGKETGRYPAMLGRVEGPAGMVSVHRTWILDGCKAPVPSPRKLMSPAKEGETKGAAIRIGGEPGHRLAVAEGIETALAIQAATAYCTWATVSAGGMAALLVPTWVEEVIIAADHDANGTGLRAARTLARRMLGTGRRVKILMPPEVGTDWADVLREAV